MKFRKKKLFVLLSNCQSEWDLLVWSTLLDVYLLKPFEVHDILCICFLSVMIICNVSENFYSYINRLMCPEGMFIFFMSHTWTLINCLRGDIDIFGLILFTTCLCWKKLEFSSVFYDANMFWKNVAFFNVAKLDCDFFSS